MKWTPGLAKAVSSLLLSSAQREQVARVQLDDAGHGWDRFGASPRGVELGLALSRHLYQHYFRVRSSGAHHIPDRGAAIVVSNHSGTLPIDGMMLWADILQRTSPARVARPIADYFVPALPFISTLFARAGMVNGSRGNVHALLDAGQLLELFPEGVRGIGKPFSERYQLQRWTVGHAELAIRHRVPVVPVGIVGAEEQWPQLTKIEGVQLLGVPYLPIPATPLPMPVRYHINYGPPIHLADDFRPEDAVDPEALGEAAARTKAAVASLLDKGLSERKGLFR